LEIPVVADVLKLNDEIAQLNRQRLHDAGVFSLDLMGAPGAGKTALIEATIKAIDARVGVVVGDLATQRDADRIARCTDQVVQINTGKGCHLDANQVRQAIGRLNIDQLDILFIENVGNLICPVGFDLGQDVKVGLFSIAEGDDKAAKHPYIVQASDVLLLNKLDLAPHVSFNLESFQADVSRLSAAVPLITLSVTAGQGVDQWIDWLERRLDR